MEHYYQNKLTKCYLIFGLILLLPRIRRFHRALIMTIHNDNTAFTNLPHASKVCLSVTTETPYAQPIQTCVY